MQMERRPCGDDLAAEVAAEQERLEAEWTDDVLRAAIRSGGIKGGPDVAGASGAVRPSPEDAGGVV